MQLLEINPRHRISLDAFCSAADSLYSNLTPSPPADEDVRDGVAAVAVAISQGTSEAVSGSAKGRSEVSVNTSSQDNTARVESPSNKLQGILKHTVVKFLSK